MAITLKQLGDIIKSKLPLNSFHIKGEVRQPKISNGHMYLMLKDDTSKIDCIVWKSKVDDIITNLKDGDNVEIKATMDYYIPRGELKLIISAVKKLNNMGDMYAQFETLKNDFTKNGYFNKKLPIPKYIRNILVITSMNGAAIHDFIYALNNSKSLVQYTTIDVIVQGPDCPKQIIDYIRSNNLILNKYDMVVITRGGGSMEDLWGFNDKTLIETIYGRNYPVLSAIGHMVDTTLLDYVADISSPTPSLAAQFIVDHNRKYLDRLNEIKTSIYNQLINAINNSINRLDKINNIKNDIFENLQNRLILYKNNINSTIASNIIQLEMLENQYAQNITLYQNDAPMAFDDFTRCIQMKQPFTLVWNNAIIEINTYTSQ